MMNVVFKLLDDEFLIAYDARDEVADPYDADRVALGSRRHAVPFRGMSSLSAC